MGMAASQARLLFITARLHDVEYQAQQLQAVKLALANQSDAAWREYNDALDATTLTVKSLNLDDGTTRTIVATFAGLTGPNGAYSATGDRYALVRNGKLLLSQDEHDKYQEFIETNPNGTADDFALFMMGIEETETETTPEGTENPEGSQENPNISANNPATPEIDEELYDYYYDLFLQIQSCGGQTEAVNPEYENNSEWLTNMIKCGQIQVYTYDADERCSLEDFEFEATSPSSDASIKYTNTTEIDKTAEKKAEAKYEHTLKQIDRKEKRIDNELSRLETERKALTTQYDSVKKVIEDNIERTFGIFS